MIVFKGGSRSRSGARTGLGASFGGLTSYLQKGPRENLNLERVEWSTTHNLDTDDPAEAAQVMRHTAAENAKVEKPVYHFGLSLEPGEHLSQQQWESVAGRMLDRMGLWEHQALVIAHNDTAKEHIHIVVNRIGPDGKAWRAFRDMIAAREVVRAVEIEYGLRLTGRDQAPPELSAGSVREARRTGVQPLADRVREEAGHIFAEATSWRDLEAGLARYGYRIERAERGSGLVVTDGSRRASLSHVDRTLSGPKLAARFGETFREHRENNPEPPQVQRRAGGREIEPLAGGTLRERAEALIDRVSSTRATFTRADIERAAFHEPDSQALAKHALRDGDMAKVGKDARGVTRYAATDYMQDEARMFEAARELRDRQDLRLDPAEVGRALERSPHLSAEQRAAVLEATTREDLALIVGRAGAGKTTAAATIADAYREAGYDVRGGALAGKAADNLQQEAGIYSRTLHSWEHAWERGRDRLHDGSVLVVDEAGMIDARQLGRVLDHAAQHQAKVILIGDPDQLKPIGPGDGFRGLLEQHAPARLETIRRQAEPWQREASENLAAGRVAPALDAYQEAGRLHVTATREGARAGLLKQYSADRREAPERGQLVLAYRNADVRQLNAEIRGARKAAGELGQGVTVRGAEYAACDRVVFLRNDNHGLEVANLGRADARGNGVKNGTLGTLEAVSPDRFVARLDDGRQVAFSPAQYDSIAHGYAVTIHKSQGATVDRTYVLADPMMNRNASYVALTRHRDGVQVYSDRQTFTDREHLDRALSRAPAKDLARDYGVSAIERQAERIERAEPLREQERSLYGDQEHIRRSLLTIRHADTMDQRLADARAVLERTAARVYTEPTRAVRHLTADPKVTERLAAKTAPEYGQMHGRAAGILRGPDAHRQAADSALPALRDAIRSYRIALGEATTARAAADKLGGRFHLPSWEAEARQVSQTLHRVQQAIQGPEKALEAAVREVGSQAAKLAVSALPTALQLPVQLAIRAVERAIDLGLGLGR